MEMLGLNAPKASLGSESWAHKGTRARADNPSWAHKVRLVNPSWAHKVRLG